MSGLDFLLALKEGAGDHSELGILVRLDRNALPDPYRWTADEAMVHLYQSFARLVLVLLDEEAPIDVALAVDCPQLSCIPVARVWIEAANAQAQAMADSETAAKAALGRAWMASAGVVRASRLGCSQALIVVVDLVDIAVASVRSVEEGV